MKKFLLAVAALSVATLLGYGSLAKASESVSLPIKAGGYVSLDFLFGFDTPEWIAVRNGGGGVVCCTHDSFLGPTVVHGVCNTAIVLYSSSPPTVLPASMVQGAVCTANMDSVVIGESGR